MPNLLYVTPEMLRKLQRHPAYRFWNPIYLNFPLRPIPLEERTFHPRKFAVEDDAIYLTVDMKFIYCRDGLCSFLYEGQDLSFRLTPAQGVLQTVDGKQFTAVVGRVATVVSTVDIELTDLDKVYHPWFDEGGMSARPGGSSAAEAASAPAAPAPAAEPAAKKAAAPEAKPAAEAEPAAKKIVAPGQKVLGKYDAALCAQLVKFRTSSKKSCEYLSQKFSLPLDDVKKIIELHFQQTSAKPLPGRAEMANVPRNIREQVVRMKRVAKKSYEFLAERFKLTPEVIQAICSEQLKRPRL